MTCLHLGSHHMAAATPSILAGLPCLKVLTIDSACKRAQSALHTETNAALNAQTSKQGSGTSEPVKDAARLGTGKADSNGAAGSKSDAGAGGWTIKSAWPLGKPLRTGHISLLRGKKQDAL